MIKLQNIINELEVNKPKSFWDTVREMTFFDMYYAEALLNNWFNNFEDYANEFGINYDEISDIEKYQYFYDYFSKISPNEIKSKINFRVFSKNVDEINEGISYRFIEMWYAGDGDFGLVLHNNNKVFLKDE